MGKTTQIYAFVLLLELLFLRKKKRQKRKSLRKKIIFPFVDREEIFRAAPFIRNPSSRVVLAPRFPLLCARIVKGTGMAALDLFILPKGKNKKNKTQNSVPRLLRSNQTILFDTTLSPFLSIFSLQHNTKLEIEQLKKRRRLSL